MKFSMYFLRKKMKTKSERGFTLVETLVAITILLVVITGPMTIAQKGMQNAFYAGDQTTAIYLAQEAIEHIQSLRDDNGLSVFNTGIGNGGNTESWYGSLPPSCTNTGVTGGCDINFIGGGYKDCALDTLECRLKVDTAEAASTNNRVYGYDLSWSDSLYTRRIRVGTMSGGAVPVTVTVSWTANIFGNPTSNARNVVLQTYIYDHYQRYE